MAHTDQILFQLMQDHPPKKSIYLLEKRRLIFYGELNDKGLTNSSSYAKYLRGPKTPRIFQIGVSDQYLTKSFQWNWYKTH